MKISEPFFFEAFFDVNAFFEEDLFDVEGVLDEEGDAADFLFGIVNS